MPLVTLVANRNTPSREKAGKLIEFFTLAETIAKKHRLKTNSYSHLINTEVGDSAVANFDHLKKTVEFEFARHSIYNGHPREKVTLEMEKFIRFAYELAQATGYEITIQRPLYYDE